MIRIAVLYNYFTVSVYIILMRKFFFPFTFFDLFLPPVVLLFPAKNMFISQFFTLFSQKPGYFLIFHLFSAKDLIYPPDFSPFFTFLLFLVLPPPLQGIIMILFTCILQPAIICSMIPSQLIFPA